MKVDIRSKSNFERPLDSIIVFSHLQSIKGEGMQEEAKVDPSIDPQWKKALHSEFSAPYFLQLKEFLRSEKKRYRIYPPGNRIFAAFDHTPFQDVKVVIIGQDPYHGPGQANGLCFSVQDGVKHPPSLQNILKEVRDDIGAPYPQSGDLSKWADQGVLLLNATLTVRKGQAGSHQGKGWERFTDAAIRVLSNEKKGLVFLLWGRFAQQKEVLIDNSKHYVLKAAHPSPFSAHKGFFGCKHFSQANAILRSMGEKEIDWALGDLPTSQ